MDLGLSEKVALVTGGSAGIGYAVAQGLAREGCKLVICGRDVDRLAQAEASLLGEFPGLELASLKADAQDAEETEGLIASSLAKFGRIDILVNNSQGAALDNPDLEMIPDEDWMESFSGKLMGYIRLTRLVLPGMKARQWGRVVNIVGTSGKEPSARLFKSGLNNAALMNFTKTVANQAAAYKVTVNTVNPGIIETPRHRQHLGIVARRESLDVDAIARQIEQTIPMGRRGNSMEVAELVVFLASACGSYITGVSIPVDGGLSSSAF